MRIELSSRSLLPMRLLPDDFFDPSPNDEEAAQLIDKLYTRIGEQAVFQVHTTNEHLPELRNSKRSIKQEESTWTAITRRRRRF